MGFEWGLRKSFMICKDCGAKWYLHYSWGTLKGVQLVNTNVNGKGSGLLQKEHTPEFWQSIALEGRKLIEEAPKVIKEREIIKEIVKIRCLYCRNLYDESHNKCPYCGGRR